MLPSVPIRSEGEERQKLRLKNRGQFTKGHLYHIKDIRVYPEFFRKLLKDCLGQQLLHQIISFRKYTVYRNVKTGSEQENKVGDSLEIQARCILRQGHDV